MNISVKLNQKKFLEILLYAYFAGETSTKISVAELMEVIKQQILVNSNETFV